MSEYTDDVDFLPNHNSGDMMGQAAFLTNTNGGMFFSMNTTAISRYCIEHVDRPFAPCKFAPLLHMCHSLCMCVTR